jgi:hypothetical protein
MRRDGPTVQSLEDMRSFIRYNDWQTDPLQRQGPDWGIASRADIFSSGCTICSYACQGAIDGKVTSARALREEQAIWAVSGPTTSGGRQPVFVWSESEACRGQLHEGMPDRWDFGWEKMGAWRLAPATKGEVLTDTRHKRRAAVHDGVE